MAKALVLLSGGLDSMLSARVLMEQGVKVTGLTFTSHFFGAAKARKAAEQLGIELKEVDFKKEHLQMVKNPKYGYGKNMNPCIDCHSLMLRYAKKYLAQPSPCQGEEKVYDLIATGEILGQRPMSQNKEALKTVADYSGIGDRVVRPLSAKLLEETAPEKEGLLIRGKLLGISGRNRKKQIELVKKFKIKEYASPGGGCLLTDPAFSERLINLFDYWPDCAGNDVELLKYGRVIWLKLKKSRDNVKVLVVIGRNKEDNEMLEKLARKGDVLIELKNEMGPTTLVRMLNNKSRIENDILEIDIPKELKKSEMKLGDEKSFKEIINVLALLTRYYAAKARGKKVNVQLEIKN